MKLDANSITRCDYCGSRYQYVSGALTESFQSDLQGRVDGLPSIQSNNLTTFQSLNLTDLLIGALILAAVVMFGVQFAAQLHFTEIGAVLSWAAIGGVFFLGLVRIELDFQS